MAEAQIELAVEDAVEVAVPDPKRALHGPDRHAARVHGLAEDLAELLEIFLSHSLLRRLLHLPVALDRDAHLDVVAQHAAAGVEHAVPDDPVILAVDREGRLEARLLAVRGLHGTKHLHRD